MLHVATIMMEANQAMEGIEDGKKIGEKLRKDVKFADDQGMIAGNESGLQQITDGLNTIARVKFKY
jgi:hypothetical protein